ncbi:hypothetical protein [Fulvivirga sediminis]|uniref:Tetratricopeptide repeat protein n=1 Tax=Fulvivirga sediminis TaxID=2803949 RepID=A0A937F7Y4_9BACT|nr:hypothetical protein [Fulvivirga sediminis]MBL3656264.1 hypothetical protein [Fulvivirga sediminis]
MRKTLTFILVLLNTSVFSCGWGPESDLYFFYNLFEQTNISAKAYYPFLREDENDFYKAHWTQEYHEGNVRLWQQLLKQWTEKDIRKTFHATDPEFKALWGMHKSDLDLQVKTYMTYARKCSATFADRRSNSWEYRDIMKSGSNNTAELIEEGGKLYASTQNEQLKLRYAYQIIRAFHYGSQYQEAVDFYEEHVADQVEKSELYYYAKDQVAGCYYSLGQYEKAAYFFIDVFNNSIDRKTSAFLSYKYCTWKGAEGKSFFKDDQDKATYITITGVRSMGANMETLNRLYEVVPNDEKVELIFMRALNDLEREIWPTQIGVREMTLPYSEEGGETLENLLAFASKAKQNEQIKNQAFWQMAASYLVFCKGDVKEAQNQLSKVSSSSGLNDQKNVLTKVYEVFSWDKMNADREEYLTSFMEKEMIKNWGTDPSWKYLIKDQVSHLYYKEGRLAQSYLMHNDIEDVRLIASLPLIDDILAFMQKPHKNGFEQLLMKKSSTIEGDYSPIEYMKYIKGLYYLKKANPQEAYTWLNASQVNEGDNRVSYQVPAKVFSNNITECFDCSENRIMEDSVYLASPFSFIESNFSKAELADYLVKLEDMAQNNTAQWKRKLAFYLLGNFYYNVSNSGYYRGLLIGSGNCCHYNYFLSDYQDKNRASEIIDSKKGYNLFDLDSHYDVNMKLSKKSYAYYEKVIENSTDKELNARCLYLMAKCELNAMYNEIKSNWHWGGYKGEVNEETSPYKRSFRRLKNECKDTQFYDEIIEECSFFRYYSSL